MIELWTAPGISWTPSLVASLLLIVPLVFFFMFARKREARLITRILSSVAGILSFISVFAVMGLGMRDYSDKCADSLSEWANTNYGIELSDSEAKTLIVGNSLDVEYEGETTMIALVLSDDGETYKLQEQSDLGVKR